MGGNTFRFKRFTVRQEGCAMKVGTDGVLLGAWCRVDPEDKQILDIGTGTGVITLMLAQRTEAFGATVEAVEIDGSSCVMARENFDRSGWGGRIRLHPASVQDFAAGEVSGKFDHIVSNPPYFMDSLTSPDPARNTARHTGSLSYGDLTDACSKLLSPSGRISLILPPAEAYIMTETASRADFTLSRRTEVWTTPKSGPKRILLELSRQKTSLETFSLVIEDAGPGTFSEEYRRLTREFYLYF